MAQDRAGWLITFEGGDGVGKSTQASRLVDRLTELGVSPLHLREPGGTPVGEAVRRMVKGEADPAPRTELLLFEAARAELVERVITPALKEGRAVVLDRFSDSSIAYQGYGRGIDLDEVRSLNDIATGGLTPDLTVLIDVPLEHAVERASGRDGSDANDRRFENQPTDFHRRVLDGFRKMAEEDPGRWLVVDGTGGEDDIAEAVWTRAAALIRVG